MYEEILKMCYLYSSQTWNVLTVVTVIIFVSFKTIFCQVNDSKTSKHTTLKLLEPLIIRDQANHTFLSLDIKLGIWVTINNQSATFEQPQSTNSAIDADKIKKVLNGSLHYLMNYLKMSFSDLWSKMSNNVKENKSKTFDNESVSNAPRTVREIPERFKRRNDDHLDFDEQINHLRSLNSESAEDQYSDIEEIIKQIYQMKTDNPVFTTPSETISPKETKEYSTSETTVSSTTQDIKKLNDWIRQQYLQRLRNSMQLNDYLLRKKLQSQRRRPTPMVLNNVNDFTVPYPIPPILTRRLMRPSHETPHEDDKSNDLVRYRRMNRHDWTLKPVLEQEISRDLSFAKKGHYKTNAHNNDYDENPENDHTLYENYDHIGYSENVNPVYYDESAQDNKVHDGATSAQIDEDNGTEYYSSADASPHHQPDN